MSVWIHTTWRAIQVSCVASFMVLILHKMFKCSDNDCTRLRSHVLTKQRLFLWNKINKTLIPTRFFNINKILFMLSIKRQGWTYVALSLIHIWSPLSLSINILKSSIIRYAHSHRIIVISNVTIKILILNNYYSSWNTDESFHYFLLKKINYN